MSATDADRDRAQSVMGWGGLSDQYLTGVEIQQRDAIAYALAEERQKAREPFLALADELDAEVDEFATYQRRYAEAGDHFGAVVSERESWTSRHAATRIRQAAEETQ